MGVYKLSNAGGLATPRTNYSSFLAGNSAVKFTNFDSIATITATGGEASVTFTSIPNTFTHLQIRASAADTYVAGTLPGASGAGIIFNGDTGTNYTVTRFFSNGSEAQADVSVNRTDITSGVGSAFGNSLTYMFNPSITDIYDYKNTTKFKSTKGVSGVRDNSTSTNQQFIIGTGLWYSTAAITSITIYSAISGWRANSTFALYGIK